MGASDGISKGASQGVSLQLPSEARWEPPRESHWEPLRGVSQGDSQGLPRSIRRTSGDSPLESPGSLPRSIPGSLSRSFSVSRATLACRIQVLTARVSAQFFFGVFLFRTRACATQYILVVLIFRSSFPTLRGPGDSCLLACFACLLCLLACLLDAGSDRAHFLVRIPYGETSHRDPLHMAGGYQHGIVTWHPPALDLHCREVRDEKSKK